jgi:hypothetical protein
VERRELLERLHSLSHYVHRGKDFNWRAGPLANESVPDGRLLISLDVDAAQFWGLHTGLQQERERLRKQRQIEADERRQRATRH